MKIRRGLLDNFHVDTIYCLMSAQQVRLLYEIFKVLDIHDKDELNDIQFFEFMRHMTDLKKKDIYKVFDMLDINGSGNIDFNEFYMLICILVAVKDKQEKQFIHCHCRAVFDLLDADGNKHVSGEEFREFGFLFNYTGMAVRKIFGDFDVSGDQQLDYKEFRMFAMACIDAQRELEEENRKKLEERIEKAKQGSLWSRLLIRLGLIPSTIPPTSEEIRQDETTGEGLYNIERKLQEKQDSPWEYLTDLYSKEKTTHELVTERDVKLCTIL